MAKPFHELTRDFSPERKANIEKEKQLLVLEYDLLCELRKNRDLTQQELADIMEVRQAAISKLENREDILVGTLERYVRALGGKLTIKAEFPDREVTLRQFGERAEGEGITQ